jgi:hypothetical protein
MGQTSGMEPRAIPFPAGGYRFVPGRQFSGGVAAEPGFALHRVRFQNPLPLAQGLAAARGILAASGRPPEALAACELRSPLPLPIADFIAFNERYLAALTAEGFTAAPPYPIGRSNLAPILAPPAEVVLFAVTFTVPAEGPGGLDFFISGKPENRAAASFEEGIVGGADVSPAGLRVKAEYVMAELRARMAELGVEEQRVTGAQAYTVHPLEPVLEIVTGRMPLAWGGLTLVPAHPPVTGLAFEVDLRAIAQECVA